MRNLLVIRSSLLVAFVAFEMSFAFVPSATSWRLLSRHVGGALMPLERRWMSATAEDAKQKAETGHKYDFSMDDVVSLCKRRGIIFPSSEIYNGYAGFYDYGPLGSELKKNVKDAWWRHFVTRREDVVGLDSSIIHNPTTWKSSGMLCY